MYFYFWFQNFNDVKQEAKDVSKPSRIQTLKMIWFF